MRSISEILKKRLQAEAEEAKVLGFSKVASLIEEDLKTAVERVDDDMYTYSSDDLKHDVEKCLWAAAVRVQDYFNKTADARDVNDLIEEFADELIKGVRISIGGDIVGKYEPLVPGEERASIEVIDDD